ncbi:delta-lactam-biosynthetic de-N-acetylase [Paenibacillus sp.]|jgi:peptidoglycan-N-acetylmuramic acid deacetylase|uniref:delta-lactam-biosynthetic de-N-acetylase n=1 Tax=Paenibacillus sp. TaxID=58172 RepID=UPI002820ADAF|nr:delta-lactam-biosynthetic de-N-acetylase [Paenibacillus sp.]MDR0269121.1 delta-lactam-biosynthetic de-N-acetylase [Paenibacillus sp.]
MKRFVIAFAAVLLLYCGLQQTASADGPYHFGFKKSKDGQPASINEEGFKGILQKNNAIFLGDKSRKELYLTFDNGYENGFTPKILDVLKEKKVPAIFFLTGHFVKDKPELVTRMLVEGHLIGNHSWSHPDMTQVSDQRLKEELEKVKTAASDTTRQQVTMNFLRPPRGIFNDRTLALSRAEGYTSVFWSIAYKDWDVNDQKGADYAYRKVISQLHPGAVILLHSISRDNAEALGRIIDGARQQGYEFKSLDALKVKSY